MPGAPVRTPVRRVSGALPAKQSNGRLVDRLTQPARIGQRRRSYTPHHGVVAASGRSEGNGRVNGRYLPPDPCAKTPKPCFFTPQKVIFFFEPYFQKITDCENEAPNYLILTLRSNYEYGMVEISNSVFSGRGTLPELSCKTTRFPPSRVQKLNMPSHWHVPRASKTRPR